MSLKDTTFSFSRENKNLKYQLKGQNFNSFATDFAELSSLEETFINGRKISNFSQLSWSQFLRKFYFLFLIPHLLIQLQFLKRLNISSKYVNNTWVCIRNCGDELNKPLFYCKRFTGLTTSNDKRIVNKPWNWTKKRSSITDIESVNVKRRNT